jgi:hypothetical protein
MCRLPGRIFLVALALVLPACASSQRTAITQQQRTRAELSEDLLDLADLSISRFEAVYLKAVMQEAGSRRLAILAVTRNEVTMNVRAMVLGDNPGRNLVDLYVWSRISMVACENRERMIPRLFGHDEQGVSVCEEAFAPLARRINALARDWIEPDRMQRIDAAIDAFLKKNPDVQTATLLRLVDLEDRRHTEGITPGEYAALQDADEGMFTPVNDATRELEQTRITGQQMLWLLSRMPTAAGWEVQAQVEVALTSPEVVTGFADLQRGASGLGQVQERLTGLSGSIDQLSERVGGQAGLRGLLREGIVLGVIAALVVIVAATLAALIVTRRMRRSSGR